MAYIKRCQKLWCVTPAMGSLAHGLRSYMASSGCQSLYSDIWTDRVLALPISFPDSIRKRSALKLGISL